jgi:Flp pilus assembly protein TadG
MTPISRHPRLRRPTSRTRKTATRGQGLVEFAVVFPLFWTVLIALIEFSFGFQSVLAVSFASRNAAVIASEAGPAAMADCAILRSIESDVTAPSSAGQIQKVDVYWTDSNGVVKAGATTTYTRSTSSTIPCSVNNVSFTVPYTRTADGYPMATRCSIRSGCSGHVGVDTVGVKITYLYPFHTPYGAVLGGTGWTLGRSSEMRMEPFQ